jgi:hypothetical protein
MLYIFNVLGFYSDGFFISAQKLNKLQLNAISNSPNTAGQHLSVHLFYCDFAISLAQRVLRASIPRNIQHKTVSQ